ncbi:MAG: mechanosensitive ion channel [Elusimicrobia bacterium]|nr:mechanosensitive ion channel [Elusimicrobiota bacterium]
MEYLSFAKLVFWIKPAGVLAAALLAGWFFRRLILGYLRRAHLAEGETVKSIAIRVGASYLPVWLVLLAAFLALRLIDVSPNFLKAFNRIAVTFWILSLTGAAASVAASAARFYTHASALPATSLTVSLIQLGVLGLGLLVVLANLGIAITPLLTALGVGSLAVALALQETLSNLFAGFYLMVSRTIRVGDYVKLETTPHEGYVTDIGWRATQIQDLASNVVVIPNSKLAQSVVTNYSQPDDEVINFVPVSVGYGVSLARVERLTLATAKSVLEELQPQVSKNFAPRVRFLAMKGTSFEMTVILKSRRYEEHFLVVHEFLKRLEAAFAKEGLSFGLNEVRGRDMNYVYPRSGP